MRILLRLAWLEAKLLLREPITVVFTLGLPVVMEFVMGGVFGNKADPDFYRGLGAMDYYMGAYVGLVVAALGLITLPTHIATYRERGVLRRFDASTIARSTVIGAQTIVMVVLAAIGGALVVAVGVAVYHPVMPKSWPLVILAFVLAAVTFAMLGSLLGLVVPTARAAQGVGIMLWFVMLILGGAGPPPEALGEGMNLVGSLTPLKHAVILIQDAWLGFGWNGNEALIVGAFFLVSLALTALVMRRRSARQRDRWTSSNVVPEGGLEPPLPFEN